MEVKEHDTTQVQATSLCVTHQVNLRLCVYVHSVESTLTFAKLERMDPK